MATRKHYSDSERSKIFQRGHGKCHICHRQLCYSTYGQRGRRGAWHVDHSKAIANGGTNHGNNLKPACIGCNEEKSTVTARTARRWNGRRAAPLSPARYGSEKASNTVVVGAMGALLGGALGGPPGALVGGFVGAALGNSINPDE
jgi:5-methylcytosine-specific restriction endonuclease McrA